MKLGSIYHLNISTNELTRQTLTEKEVAQMCHEKMEKITSTTMLPYRYQIYHFSLRPGAECYGLCNRQAATSTLP